MLESNFGCAGVGGAVGTLCWPNFGPGPKRFPVGSGPDLAGPAPNNGLAMGNGVLDGGIMNGALPATSGVGVAEERAATKSGNPCAGFGVIGGNDIALSGGALFGAVELGNRVDGVENCDALGAGEVLGSVGSCWMTGAGNCPKGVLGDAGRGLVIPALEGAVSPVVGAPAKGELLVGRELG